MVYPVHSARESRLTPGPLQAKKPGLERDRLFCLRRSAPLELSLGAAVEQLAREIVRARRCASGALRLRRSF